MDNVEQGGTERLIILKDFFGKFRKSLLLAGKYWKQNFLALLAAIFKKTYTFGPTFRAENSKYCKTCFGNFGMIEPEIAFADINDNMQLAEDMVKLCVNLRA